MPGGGAKPGERRGGRQKGSRNLSSRESRAVAQRFGEEVLEGLMEIFRDTTQPGNFRIMAGREVLDRAYGKSVQPLRASGSIGIYDWSKVAPDRLRLVYDTLRLAHRQGIGDG